MEKITKRQKELLSIIYQYIKSEGYPPTFEEMKDKLGVVSNQSILDLLSHLEKKKFIKRNETAARSIVILDPGYKALRETALAPVLGVTHAGAPTEAIEISGEWQQLSPGLTQLQNNVFLLKIQGDSMINAGIDNGDLVLVKEDKEFVSGDIVLAQINDETTVKRFVSDDKPPFVYLKPENPKYKVIPCTESTRLKGKIIHIFKKGSWQKPGEK